MNKKKAIQNHLDEISLIDHWMGHVEDTYQY